MDPDVVLVDRERAINGGSRLIEESLVEDSGIPTWAAGLVADVVRSGRTQYWRGGPAVHRLERSFADHVGRRGAFFHNSGTAALQTALYAVGVRDGSPVALSNSGFVASINVLYHLRARPVFLPTNPDTLLVERDVASAVAGRDCVAAMLTHFFGNVVDLDPTFESSGADCLIEDAGQAYGALYRGKPVGSVGTIGSFACSHKKLVTAGQGGLNVFDDDTIAENMRVYAHHGKNLENVEVVPGYNFRGGEMEATLAYEALQELPERVAARNAAARVFQEGFKALGLKVAQMFEPDRDSPAWFDVPVILDEKWSGDQRHALIRLLNAEGIPVWAYPSLIGIKWVKPYMIEHGWWTSADEDLLVREDALWSRVIVIGTQFTIEEARRLVDAMAQVFHA